MAGKKGHQGTSTDDLAVIVRCLIEQPPPHARVSVERLGDRLCGEVTAHAVGISAWGQRRRVVVQQTSQTLNEVGPARPLSASRPCSNRCEAHQHAHKDVGAGLEPSKLLDVGARRDIMHDDGCVSVNFALAFAVGTAAQ